MSDRDAMFAGFALYDPIGHELFLGTEERLLPLDASDAVFSTLQTTGRTFVESAGDLTGVRSGDIRSLIGYPLDVDSYRIPGRSEGATIAISGGQANEMGPLPEYDRGLVVACAEIGEPSMGERALMWVDAATGDVVATSRTTRTLGGPIMFSLAARSWLLRLTATTSTSALLTLLQIGRPSLAFMLATRVMRSL